MDKIKWNLIILFLAGFLIFLQYQLWFEAGGLHDMFKLKQSVQQQNIINENLKTTNSKLIFQIARSQHSEDDAEARARDELGMIRQGETYYQFVH